MTSYFYRDFGPERLSIKHTSFIFSRGLKLSPCREDGRVESYWLSALNFLVRIAIQPATYSAVLPFIKCRRAGLPLAGETRIDIIGELT